MFDVEAMGARIRDLRTDLQMSQYDLARLTGYNSRAAISVIEKGKQSLTPEKIHLFARALRTTPEYILGMDNPDGATEKKSNIIPVLGRVQAGYPVMAVENIIDYEEISEEMAKNGTYFGLVIKGSSMEPRMFEDDIVIVKRTPQVENGQIAVVLVNGDEATVKKFYKEENGVVLRALNPSFPALMYTPEQCASLPLTVIGRVVEVRGKC